MTFFQMTLWSTDSVMTTKVDRQRRFNVGSSLRRTRIHTARTLLCVRDCARVPVCVRLGECMRVRVCTCHRSRVRCAVLRDYIKSSFRHPRPPQPPLAFIIILVFLPYRMLRQETFASTAFLTKRRQWLSINPRLFQSRINQTE